MSVVNNDQIKMCSYCRGLFSANPNLRDDENYIHVCHLCAPGAFEVLMKAYAAKQNKLKQVTTKQQAMRIEDLLDFVDGNGNG